MQMTFRWYGEGNDSVTLDQIRQIPGVEGIVWALHDKMPGEVWEIDEIAQVQKQLDKYGFNMDVVESVLMSILSSAVAGNRVAHHRNTISIHGALSGNAGKRRRSNILLRGVMLE